MQIPRSAIVLFFVFLFSSLNAFAIKPFKEYLNTPSNYECEYDSVAFSTSDNVTLAGWYLHSNLDDHIKPTIIFSYGDAGNMAYFLDYGIELIDNGFDVFFYDYRGFGSSDKFTIDKDMLIYREFLIDLNAAADFVLENYNSHIVLFGHSMGATLSISVAGSREDILAVVAEGPCGNTADLLARVNLMQEKNNDSRRFKNESIIPLHLQPENAIENFQSTALYVFTGSTDEIVTAEVVYQLYSSCPSELKSMWVAPGTDHANTVSDHTEQYFNNIYCFLNGLLED